MATYSISSGGHGSPLFVLTAGAESSVTFAEDLEKVEVYSDGTAPVWWTCSGETPSTSTGVGYLIPGAAIDVRSPKSGSATVVKLISTGTPNVRVQRGD